MATRDAVGMHKWGARLSGPLPTGLPTASFHWSREEAATVPYLILCIQNPLPCKPSCVSLEWGLKFCLGVTREELQMFRLLEPLASQGITEFPGLLSELTCGTDEPQVSLGTMTQMQN